MTQGWKFTNLKNFEERDLSPLIRSSFPQTIAAIFSINPLTTGQNVQTHSNRFVGLSVFMRLALKELNKILTECRKLQEFPVMIKITFCKKLRFCASSAIKNASVSRKWCWCCASSLLTFLKMRLPHRCFLYVNLACFYSLQLY